MCTYQFLTFVLLIHIFILLFQSGAYHWEKVEEEFYRMHQVSVSSPCIKSLYQLFLLSNCIESSISSLGIKSPYQVFHVKSLHQFSVSILCIKSLHQIFMFSLFIESFYKVFESRPCIKSSYQVFVSSLRIKVFVSKSSYQVFVSCLNYWLNKFCKTMLKSSRSFAILQLYFSL